MNANHISSALTRSSNRKTIRWAGFASLLALVLPILPSKVHAQSALDGFDPRPNDRVRVAVVQPDGKILIGGTFTTISPNGAWAVTRNRIARLNPDGTLDTAFNPDANQSVSAIALQADGKILVGGNFTSIGGQPRNNIARLDATTGLADSFDPNASGDESNPSVFSIALQADGKILVGGNFDRIGGQARNSVARLDGTTGLADSFDPNANHYVNELTLQADGKILVGGAFTSIGGQPRNRMARLDPTTGVADSFDPNPTSWVHSIALQADGKILVGGNFTGIGGQPRNFIARLDPTTGLADSFDPNPNYPVGVIALQADGRIVVGGLFSRIGGPFRNRIARLDPATGLADSLNPNAGDQVDAIAIQADGKILIGGPFMSVAGQGLPHLARLEADGRLDRTLNLNMPTQGAIYAIAVQPDGKVLIGGWFSSVLGVPRYGMARLNSDGTLDTAFDANVNNIVHTIAVQPDGKILVGGQFSSIGGQTRNRIARLDAVTGLADSFNPNANNIVFAIAVQTDGKVLASGYFDGANSIGGETRKYIARLDPTTGLADSFDPNPNGHVSSIAVQADGKILVGGSFQGANSIGGQTRNRIARLDVVTGLADSFDPNANSSVGPITVQADGKILAAGSFTTIGGQTRNRMARLDAVTGLADSFDPNVNSGGVAAIVVQADGKILVGGGFSGANSIGGQSRNFIARLDATTGLADSFDPNASWLVYSVAVQADGKVLAGTSQSGVGQFIIGGQTRNVLARLSNDTAALQDLAATPTTITWTQGGSSPQFIRVAFEYSTDNVNYTPLGSGTAAGSSWILTGLSLPAGQNIYIRARGCYRGGYVNGSESVVESVRNVFLAGPAPTPTPTTPTPTPTLTPSPSPTPIPSTPTPTPTASPSSTPTSTPSPSPTSTPTSTPTPTATPTPAPPTPTPTPTSTPTATPGILGNISTRLRVGTGDNVLIGGFIVTGTQPKKVIVRAIGPSLASLFPAVLADPILELRDSSGSLIAVNDNWRSDQEVEIIATSIPPSHELESAIVATLPANGSAYTTIVRGASNGTGIGVVEAYDLDQTVDSKLANISTRGLVQTGDGVLIGGLIVLGHEPLRVIVRAIGPSLPVWGALGDPTLDLYDGNGALVAANDNWRTDQEAEIIATTVPPSSGFEAAIVRNLAPGNYTAVVRGTNSTTGVAVVEAYGLN